MKWKPIIFATVITVAMTTLVGCRGVDQKIVNDDGTINAGAVLANLDRAIDKIQEIANEIDFNEIRDVATVAVEKAIEAGRNIDLNDAVDDINKEVEKYREENDSPITEEQLQKIIDAAIANLPDGNK